MVRHREQRRADRRYHQQCALDPPWTISVEEDTDWYLGSSEGQEVNRSKQAEIVSTEPQFRRQWSRHDRIDRPEQIGDVIAEDEWQEDAQDQRSVFDLVLRHLSRCRQPGWCRPSRWDRPLTYLDPTAGTGISEKRCLYGLEGQRCCVLSDGSNACRRVVAHARCLSARFVNRGSSA